MAKVKFKTTVYREGEIPLVDDTPPVVPAEPAAPEYEPPRLRLCAVLATCWYIVFASIEASALIYLIRYPLEPAEYVSDWRAVVIGLTSGFGLCGITLAMRACARREQP